MSLTWQLRRERSQHQPDPQRFCRLHSFQYNNPTTPSTQAPPASRRCGLLFSLGLTGRLVPPPHQLLFASPHSSMQDAKIAQSQRGKSLNAGPDVSHQQTCVQTSDQISHLLKNPSDTIFRLGQVATEGCSCWLDHMTPGFWLLQVATEGCCCRLAHMTPGLWSLQVFTSWDQTSAACLRLCSQLLLQIRAIWAFFSSDWGLYQDKTLCLHLIW